MGDKLFVAVLKDDHATLTWRDALSSGAHALSTRVREHLFRVILCSLPKDSPAVALIMPADYDGDVAFRLLKKRYDGTTAPDLALRFTKLLSAAVDVTALQSTIADWRWLSPSVTSVRKTVPLNTLLTVPVEGLHTVQKKAIRFSQRFAVIGFAHPHTSAAEKGTQQRYADEFNLREVKKTKVLVLKN